MTRSSRRAGVVMVWVLVLLAALTIMAAAVTRQFMLTRQAQTARDNRVQALWLARSGVELAAARLLEKPDGYTGELLKPIPGAEVKITVTPDPAAKGVYRVECEVRYSAPASGLVAVAAARTVKRVDGPDGVRVEVGDAAR